MPRLIEVAAGIDTRTHALVLLGLHAGLRRSELLGLEWEDVNLQRRQIAVRRAVISKYVDTPKSGHGRVIDLSAELTAALERHLAASSAKTGRSSGRTPVAPRWPSTSTLGGTPLRRVLASRKSTA
jgi:integrase